MPRLRWLLCLCLLALAAPAARACKCVTRSFATELSFSTQVFSGQPLRRAVTPAYRVRYLFAVARMFKGAPADTVTIETGFGGPDCGFVFEVGRPYLVFAAAGRTTHCSYTAALAESTALGPLLAATRRSFADSLGCEAAPRLNAAEATYLNSVFQDRRGAFSFQDQRVAFYTGAQFLDKRRYLRGEGNEGSGIDELLVLTPAERQRAGGYDALVARVAWRPRGVRPGLRRRLVRQLGRRA